MPPTQLPYIAPTAEEARRLEETAATTPVLYANLLRALEEDLAELRQRAAEAGERLVEGDRATMRVREQEIAELRAWLDQYAAVNTARERDDEDQHEHEEPADEKQSDAR